MHLLFNLFNPSHVFSNLGSNKSIEDILSIIQQKSGIYPFICIVDGKQYIGSAKNLAHRFKEHLAGVKSNTRLQRAFGSHGIDKYIFVVYEFCPYTLPHILELENAYLTMIDPQLLYNFRLSATSMLGYKHTAEAIAKMIARFDDPTNHPMLGKSHTPEARLLISKPGALNPMYGKHHTDATRAILSAQKARAVYIYDLEDKFIQAFASAKLAAEHFGVWKGTIGRYVRSGKVFQDKYIIRDTLV